MSAVAQRMRDVMAQGEAKLGPWPSGPALRRAFARFPAWLDDDIANVVFAVAVHDVLAPRVSAQGADGSTAILASGALAQAAALTVGPGMAVQTWSPPAPLGATASNAQPSLRRHSGIHFSAAVVTDLLEAAVDPLAALRGVLAELDASGTAVSAPIIIACRSADVTAVARPSLGTCTEFGLQQLLLRAGLAGAVKRWALWGRVDYTAAALADGEHLSLRSLLARSFFSPVLERHASDAFRPDESFVAAIAEAAEGTPLGNVACAALGGSAAAPGREACRSLNASATGAESAAAGRIIDAMLDSLVRDHWEEARNSWPAVVYALIERV